MPTLYGVYRSRATRNVWLAEELGLTLDHVPVIQAYRLADPLAADAPMNTRSPAFLAISPAGAVPVLKDGDLVISESLAINFYLAKKAGGPLAPRDLAEEAQMMQWAIYAMTAVEPHALAIMQAPKGAPEVEDHAARLHRPLRAIETHLATQSHLVGGRFTIADLGLAECLRYAQALPGMFEEFPAVTAWLAACQSRPAFKAMWAKREAEPA
ncbi:MAG: glutathione S-transferase family protein [Limimaricola sp.]|uniref:glutathione S-transferase family protein n=1 Tax=Limimaricola sp. TaxID=2211665 RepID=UPI001D8070E4|nr:glutathione S-transferase family protein [Limimaricola sp.]MBI1416377.1 glutathione S-transferase family protein [Limimaricola sp.]